MSWQVRPSSTRTYFQELVLGDSKYVAGGDPARSASESERAQARQLQASASPLAART